MLEVTVIKLGSEVSVRIGNPKNINVNEISNSDHQPQQNGTSAQQILSGKCSDYYQVQTQVISYC